MAKYEHPISVTIELTDGTPTTLNLTRDDAYTLGVQLIGQSGIPDQDEDMPLLDQSPMMAVEEPEMAFGATHSDALLFVIKPSKLRPIHVTISRDTAEQIHEAIGKALDDTQARPTIRTQ